MRRTMARHLTRSRSLAEAAGLTAVLLIGGCQPTIKVEAPDKPIVINLNVKIEQEVRIKVEKDADQVLQQRGDIF
jgi:YnbE-like lipoprotein